jgi:CRP/FNR family transcriptional regulator, anaerobic regulatory protein
MNPRQTTLVDSSRPTLLLQSAASPARDQTEMARFVEAVCGQGDCLHLRPQQRVPLPPAEKVIVLREGMLAIDAMPAKGKLQVLDFLVAGDVVSASTVLPTSGVSLRAITSASLVSLDPPAVDRAVPAHDYWTFLIAQCLNQLARANIHQLMIGRLETEPRVASFVLGLALRNIRKNTPEISVALPMSRTDIANYLVINCDTLSRTMMRFCDCGLIERESRHAIRVIDLNALRKKSPLASLLSAVFEKESLQEISFGRYAERNTFMPSVRESHDVIPAVVTTGPLSRSGVEHPHASRGGW